MSHLRKYLEQTGVIAPEDLDAALRRQQIYGGSLDTVLLELGVCDPFTLGELLTQSCGLQVVPIELLENGLDRPWAAIPHELVDIGWSVPLVADEERVVVAVHPDLPNERLGELYRTVEGVVPLVTPECCLEKVAAERAASVVPQRYAVLCAAYLSSLRRRPSVSDAGFAILPSLGAGEPEDTQTGLPPRAAPPAVPPPDAAMPAPSPDPERATAQYGISVDEKSPAFAPPPLPSQLEPDSADPREHPVTPNDAPLDQDGEAPADGRVPGDVAAADVVPDPGIDVAPPPVGAASTDVLTVPPPSLARDAPPGATAPDVAPAEPLPVAHAGAAPDAVVLTVADDVRTGAPPIRFTARGTLIGAENARKGDAEAAASAASATVAAAAQRLRAAQTKDEVVAALTECAALLRARLALFRIRTGGLVGMRTEGGHFTSVEGTEVPLTNEGLGPAVANGRWAGTTTDAGLCAALGLRGAPIPCVLHRIDVAGRPVMAVYLDREGGEFLPSEANVLFELAVAASAALEGMVQARRMTPTPGTAVPPPREARTEPPSAVAGAPAGRARTGGSRPILESGLGQTEVPKGPVTEVPIGPAPSAVQAPPPPEYGLDPRGWGAVPQPVQSEYSSGPIATAREKFEDASTGKSLRRETQVDGSPRSYQPPPEGKPPILTVSATPPPPALPPPPPMRSADEVGPDTLTGVPPGTGAGPRFIPPPLDERENSGIISLAPPIDQPTARGRILLDEEDWDDTPIEETSEDERRAVDGVLAALGRQEADVDDLKALGESGLRGLAATFPGTLEVLRRDLRALPPPSAHGPHIRATIRLGGVFVEHLLPLFGHTDPDVRFYAAFVFQELRDARAMQPLSTLAFDAAGDVRVVAMRVLETYNRFDGFDAAASRVRGELDSANRTRQLYAARALGTLRDKQAIPDLVDRLASKDRFIQEASLESLCSITGQQHGLKPHRWKSWYTEHAHRHRVEWVIDSVRHRDLPVRRWAHDELIRVTGHRIPFSPLGDRKSRDVAADAWVEWWAQTGKARFELASGDQPTG